MVQLSVRLLKTSILTLIVLFIFVLTGCTPEAIKNTPTTTEKPSITITPSPTPTPVTTPTQSISVVPTPTPVVLKSPLFTPSTSVITVPAPMPTVATPSPTPEPTPTVILTTQPSNSLNKTDVTQTSFTLTWSAVTDATSYKVYKDNVLYADNIKTNTKSITNLTSGSTYSMQVSAVNTEGESTKSTALNVSTLPSSPTPAQTPQAPTNLDKSDVAQTSFILTWSAVTDAVSYKVYKDNVLYADNINTNAKSITNLTSGSTYSMQVSAVNTEGESTKSTALSVSTLPSSPSSPTLSSPVTVASAGGQQPKIKKYGNNIYILNTNSSRDLMFYKSTDTGASFASSSNLGTPVMNGTEFEFAMDSNGYLYAFWEDQNNDQLYVRKSVDSGTNWSSKTTISNDFIGNWMDQPSCYFNGTLYLLFRGYKNSKIELYLTKSTDNGNSFSTPVQVTNNGFQEDYGKIAVSGSNIYIIYLDSSALYNIYLVKSTNGGTSFSSPMRVNRTIGKTDFGSSLAVDSSGNVFVAYEDTTTDSEGDLFVAKSTDGGSTFNHTQAADSTYRNQDYPKIFVDGSNNIHLLWNDNRVNKSYGSVFYTRSLNSGSSYETNIGIRDTGGISNGSLYVDSNVVYITVVDYNTSPFATLFYKLTL